jgi:predicted nucleic acid-binding protein
MKILFDTSVLVAALVDQLPNHEAAFDCFRRYSSGENEGFCTSHTLAECYATLTALPLPRRIQASEAQQLISQSIAGRLTILPLSPELYLETLVRVGTLGLRSGIVYDALHLAGAETAQCERIYTYNLKDFNKLNPKQLLVSAP